MLSAQAPETLPAGVSNSSPLDETRSSLGLAFSSNLTCRPLGQDCFPTIHHSLWSSLLPKPRLLFLNCLLPASVLVDYLAAGQDAFLPHLPRMSHLFTRRQVIVIY